MIFNYFAQNWIEITAVIFAILYLVLAVKQNIFAAMSSSHQNIRLSRLEKAKENGFNSTQNINRIISYEQTSEILKGIADFEQWNSTNIQKRSERICELVWDQLVEWLEPNL